MLVLTRKATETIKIGNDVVIKIICTGTKSVRIGIEAPSDVRIMRGELLEESDVAEASRRANCTEQVPCYGEAPIVADAVADVESPLPMSMEEPVVIGPMTTQKFLHEFNDVLPGRSIRRMLEARKQAVSAK